MGTILEQQHRLVLHKTVHRLLSDVADNLKGALQLEEILKDVFSVVRGACTEFSETWNSRHACALARRLPVEVMTECFRLADITTCVRASHVSRRWRAVALSDCRLWTDIRISSFSVVKNQVVALTRLEHLLLRSRPLPFRLHLPHSTHGQYTARVFGALRSDLHRLEEYDGPTHVFLEDLQLPALTSFKCIQLHIPFGGDVFFLQRQFAAHLVPNLRKLVAPVLKFPDGCEPYRALQHLVSYISQDSVYDDLFRFCPNLVTAEFRGIRDDSMLPPGPLPRSLQQVTLRVPNGFLVTADFEAVLQPWTDARIPRLGLFRAADVAPLIPIFLSSHELPVKLTTYRDDSDADIVMTTVPEGEFRWEIGTLVTFWDSYDCFNQFGVLCEERLTALSIPLLHLWVCLDAGTFAPHLVELQIRLAEGEEVVFPAEGQEYGFHLRAPQLRRIVFDIADSFYDATLPSQETSIFKNLDDEFRSLFVYDADLLDSITVHCAAHHLEAFSCHDFARFAKIYTIDTLEL